jgi:hypothetical protein
VPPAFTAGYSWPPPPGENPALSNPTKWGLPLPYHEGDPIPEGYSIQRSSLRKWPFIVGASAFGAGYILGVLTAGVARLQTGDGGWAYMAIPAVGPFVALNQAKDSILSDGEKGWIIGLGCFQLAGLLMTALAPLQPRKATLVWTGLAPLASPHMAGVGLSGAF